MNNKNQDVLVFEHSWVWIILDRWVLAPVFAVVLAVGLLLLVENRVDFFLLVAGAVFVALIVLHARLSSRRSGRWEIDLGADLLTDLQERDPWWNIFAGQATNVASPSAEADIETKPAHPILYFLFGLVDVTYVSAGKGEQEIHLSGVKNPPVKKQDLIASALGAWKNGRDKDEIQSHYEAWRQSKSRAEKFLAGIWWLITLPITIYRLIRRISAKRAIQAPREEIPSGRAQGANIVTNASSNLTQILVEATSGFVRRSGIYRCSEPTCDEMLSHPLGSTSESGEHAYPALGIWVDERLILGLFCSVEHCLPHIAAARDGNVGKLAELRHVGRLFQGNISVKYVQGGDPMSEPKAQGSAELAPKDKGSQGAELVPETAKRPLWQRPAMVIAAVVMTVVLLAGGSILLGPGPTEQSLDFSPTFAPPGQSAVNATGTKPKVISSPAPAAVVPSLIKIAQCSSKVPAGVEVWFWTPAGMITPTDGEAKPAIKFNGTETMNGMGLKSGSELFCSVTKTGYTWTFHKK